VGTSRRAATPDDDLEGRRRARLLHSHLGMSSTFYTIGQRSNGDYQVVRGNSGTGIGVAQRSFRNRSDAQRYIDRQIQRTSDSGWLDFVNGDRNRPCFPGRGR
jgi:hypothetical protein